MLGVVGGQRRKPEGGLLRWTSAWRDVWMLVFFSVKGTAQII